MSNIYNMHQYLLLKDSKVRENKYLKFKILTSFQYMLQLTYFRGGKITEIIQNFEGFILLKPHKHSSNIKHKFINFYF